MSFPPYEIYKSTEYDWLGTIPTSWRTQKFRHLFKESSEKIEGEVFGEMLSVSGYRGIQRKEYDDENRRRSEEDLVGYRIVRKGQLVVNTMWLNYAGLGFSELDGHVSPAYRSYWPKSDEYSKYLHYLLRSEHYVNGYTRLLTGVRPNSLQMSRDNMMSFPVVLPPKAEQIAIATFLDRETAKIDALIAEQKRLIELLQEKRQAVISHAVTKGLNPNAPMKDSGVEWLGDVPEHWGVRRLRHIGTLQNGLNISGEAFGEGDPFISYGDVYKNPNVPQKPAGLVRSTPEDKQKYGLERGDVLFTRTSETVDDIGVASTCLEQIPHSTFAGFLIRLRPLKGVLEPRYSTHLFRNQGVKTHFAGTMNMVTRASLSQGELGNLAICLPSLDEQLKIASAIEEMAGQSDQLISSAWKLVALLQERRSALISAAVTGQIDVRGLTEEVAA